MCRKVITLLLSLISATTFAQWTRVLTYPSVYTRNISEINGNLYSSTSGSGIYKSSDGGISWNQINNGLISQQANDVYEVIETAGNLYAATTDGIYKSTDGGDSWVKKSNGITIGPGALYEFTASIFEYNGVLFTGAWNGIYRSTDYAETWSLTNVSGEGINAKNFTEHDGILFGARESINSPVGYKSFDNGSTWQDLTGLSYFNTITFLSEPGYLWAGIVGGVWLSTDDGITWEDRSNGLSLDPYSSSIIRINGILLTSLKFGGSGIYSSSDNGLNWINITDGLPFLTSIDRLIEYNGNILAATSEGLWEKNISEIPVELVSFNAEYTGRAIVLKWSTATETNNKGFEVQKAGVGDRDSKIGGHLPQWDEIGFVDGAGTTSEPKVYSFIDKNIEAGVYIYRLKQVNLDGTFSYSNEVEIDVKAPAYFSLEQNYPNPFNPSTNIIFNLKSDSRVTLRVYNILGEDKKLLTNENLNAGEHKIEFNASGLSSGIYLYNLNATGNDGSNYTATRKMLLLK